VGRDPFFDEDPELDSGELSDGIWAEVAPAPQGEMSPSEAAPHEWVALEQCAAEIPEISQWNARTSGPKGEWAPVSVPTMRYRCRRCGREIACLIWETPELPDGGGECTERMLTETHGAVVHRHDRPYPTCWILG